MTVSSVPLYSWKIPQGTLSVISDQKGYQYQLKASDQTLIPLTSEHIEPLPLEGSANKIDELCMQYFPQIKKSGSDTFKVVFHLSAIPYGQPIYAPEIPSFSQQKKNFGIAGVSFNSLEETRSIQFSKEAPSYRRVVQGLNLQGQCQNRVCEAYQKVIYMPMGIGDFNIFHQMRHTTCPACAEEVGDKNIDNLGFWNCRYQIEGSSIQEDSKKPQEINQTATAHAQHYTTFKPGKNVVWTYLQVTTTCIKK